MLHPALRALLVSSSLVVGCTPLLSSCATHTVRQSTLFATPSAGPPQTSHGRLDAFISGSGTTLIETESRPPSDETGTWISRGQLDGQLAVRITRFVSVRAAGFLAFSDGAVATRPTTLERPSDVSFGGGPIATFGYAAEDEPFFARAELGFLIGFFPSVLLVTVVDPLATEPGGRQQHLSWMPIVHGGLAAGYWITEIFALSGGVVLRNQPRVSFDEEFGVIEEASAAIDFGDVAGIPWIAAELEIDHTIGIVAQLQLPIMADVVFGPALSIGVRGVIGQGPSSTRRRRERPPPPEPENELELLSPPFET